MYLTLHRELNGNIYGSTHGTVKLPSPGARDRFLACRKHCSTIPLRDPSQLLSLAVTFASSPSPWQLKAKCRATTCVRQSQHRSSMRKSAAKETCELAPVTAIGHGLYSPLVARALHGVFGALHATGDNQTLLRGCKAIIASAPSLCSAARSCVSSCTTTQPQCSIDWKPRTTRYPRPGRARMKSYAQWMQEGRLARH